MSRYIRHVIQDSETLEQISQRHYGDATQWYAIVQYNGLEYPYITNTVEEKLVNVEGLRTSGDELIIPIEPNILDDSLQRLGHNDREAILDLTLGRDLNMSEGEDYYNRYGGSTEVMELSEDGLGDIATVSGVENVKQAVIARLLTPKGSLLLHPDYGSDLNQYMGMRTGYGMVPVIDTEIMRTINSDGRIRNVDKEYSHITEGVYSGSFTCYLLTVDDYFKLVVDSDGDDYYIVS